MRSSLFTLFLLSLEAAPASSLRIPLPLQSPSPRLAASSGKRIGARWSLDLKSGMELEKRRKSQQGDTDDSDSGSGSRSGSDEQSSLSEEGGGEGKRRPKRPHKGSKPDGDEVAKVMNAHDGGKEDDDNDNDQKDEEGEQPKKGKGGKKQKHVPGSHHRDDRPSPPPTEEKHGKHRPTHKGKGRHGNERRYLSSNLRYHEKKEMSVWDYDRHTKRVGEFDPLHGTGLREELELQKRGHGADDRGEGGRHDKDDDDGGRHSKHGDGGRERHGKHGSGGRKDRHKESDDRHFASDSDVRGKDFLAAGQAEHVDRPHINAVEPGGKGHVRGDSLPDIHSQDHLPSHRQGVTLGDGTSAQSKSLASPAHPNPKDAQPDHKNPSANQGRGLLDPLRVDDMLGLEYDAYDCEEELVYGHHTLLGRDDQDPSANGEQTPPPAPGPPPTVSVIDGGPRMFADRIIWQPKSDHPEKHGGLERRRKNKHKNEDVEDEEGGGGNHGRNRHGDDEDDYGSSKGKHRGGDDEEGEYGTSSSGKKGQGRYDDEDDNDDGYSAKGTESRTKGKGPFDDEDAPYSKSNPLSGFDEDDPDAPLSSTKSKSKFDDGQYRPSSYANSGIDDCATLSSFYTTMKGETWTPASDWSGSAVSSKAAACCTWTGVTCDEFERVIGVDVSSLGLSGPLGSELFSLDALLRLDISGNALTSLPDRFDTLPTLANMNAGSNNLTGSIPTTLLTHPILKTLNLASNAFNGEIVINSVNITSITLNRNQLTSVRIMEGSGLVKVDLADNKFQGSLPDLSSSSDLQIFDASNNNTGPLFDISSMTSLTRLDVRTNGLSGPFPSSFAQLKRLTSLYLSYNAFTGPFPSEQAPPMLASCYVNPNPIAPCPSPAELANPDSLAAKCHAACPKAPGSGGGRGTGIPVSPLPGEAGSQSLYIDPHSSRYVLAPDTSSQPANVNINPNVNTNTNSLSNQPAQGSPYNQPNGNVNNPHTPLAAGTVPSPYNNNGMDASVNGIGGTRQQQMVGAATPIRIANGGFKDSVSRTWIMAGLANSVVPLIIGFVA